MRRFGKYIHKDFKLFIGALALTLIFFGANLSIEYATDSYVYYVINLMDCLWLTVGCGRVIQGVIWFISDIFIVFVPFINITSIAYLSYLAAILFLTCSIYEYALLIKSNSENKLLSFLVACVTIINPFVVEYFLFFEKGCFMLGMFFSVKAVKNIIQYINLSEKKAWKNAIIFSFLAVFIYQNYVFLIIVLSLPFIAVQCKNIKSFMHHNIHMGVITGIPLTCAFIFQKLAGSTRVEHHSFNENIKTTLKFMKIYLKNAHFMLPKLWYVYAVAIILLIWAWLISKSKQKLVLLFRVAYVGMGTTFFGLFVYITGVSSDSAMRIAYPFMCMIGVLIALMVTSEMLREHKRAVMVETVIVLFLFVSFTKIEMVLSERYKVNQADKIWSEQILQTIDEYEEKNDTKVTQIAFYYDESCGWFYQDLRQGEVSSRALYVPWSQENILNYYSKKKQSEASEKFYEQLKDYGISEKGIRWLERNKDNVFVKSILSTVISNRRFTKIDPDESIEQYFADKNWDYFSSDQIIIIGDTAHICIY